MNDFETAKQLFLEGVRLLEAKSYQAAEIRFGRSLELVPDRVSTLNNLSAVKIRLKKFAEAEEFARKAIALEEKSPEAWSNLASALTATNRHEEALQAYDRTLNGNPSHAKAWLVKITTLIMLERYDNALTACDQALRLNPSHEVLYAKSLALNKLYRPDEAKKVYLTSIQMRAASSPVFIAERRVTQKADILVVNHYPPFDPLLKPFEVLHLGGGNFPSQLARQFPDDFHFTFVFDVDATTRSARERIPRPDFVLNNCTNGERILTSGSLSGLVELVDIFGVPVVNHPSNAIQTTRDASAKLLEGIPGVLVPKTMRFSSAGKTSDELVREIEDQYDYPLITRTTFAQEGKGMTKVDSRDALVAILSSGLPEKFFVTQFVDTRRGSKFYRKIRAAAVKDEIIIGRVDFSDHWNVRGRKSEKRVPFYLENRHLLDEEKRICRDPEAALGRSAIESLQAIRDRIPLDVFGIDFDVDGDGLLVFYEANATMNLFSTARKEVPNPKEPEDRLKLAFQRYFTSLVAPR